MCKAISIPDDHYGEEVCLCVIPVAGSACTEQELRSVLKSNLSSFKVPKYILFFDTFPVSSAGKVLTRELKGAAETRL